MGIYNNVCIYILYVYIYCVMYLRKPTNSKRTGSLNMSKLVEYPSTVIPEKIGQCVSRMGLFDDIYHIFTGLSYLLLQYGLHIY